MIAGRRPFQSKPTASVPLDVGIDKQKLLEDRRMKVE